MNPRKRDATDAQLAEQVKGGDSAAFAELTRRHYRSLFAHTVRSVGNRHDSEDLVQETLLRYWRFRASFDANRGGQISTYLHAILCRVIVDHFRKKGRVPIMVPISVASEFSTDRDPPDPTRRLILDQFLRTELNEDDAVTLVMVDGMGYSHDEAADALEMTRSGVAKRMMRIHDYLGMQPTTRRGRPRHLHS